MEGTEDQWEEAVLGEVSQEEEKKTLFVRVTIISSIYHLFDHVSLTVFTYLSTLCFSMKPVFSASLFYSISEPGHMVYGSRLSQGCTY